MFIRTRSCWMSLEDLRNLLGEHRDIVTLLSHGHLEKAEKLLYRHLLDS